MDVTLTKPELLSFIEQQVRDGRFASAADVIEAGLVSLMLDEPDIDGVDKQTRAAIAEADTQFARGEDRDFQDFAAEFRRNLNPEP
jgi:Arc/MetJ-type ribon-helix-helix transcriptional regulator